MNSTTLIKPKLYSILILLSIFSLTRPNRVAAQSCTSITDPVTCASNPDCRWDANMNGCTMTCSRINDPVACGYSPGCRWDASAQSCAGSAQAPYSTLSYGTGPFSQYVQSFLQSIGLKPKLTTLPGVINAILPIILIFAGLILFLMLISGGFTMLTSASNPEAADKGKQRITTALVGFVIIFAAYWITQIVEIVLGVNIL